MGTSDGNYFHQLPTLTSEVVSELDTGQGLPLLLLEYVPSGGGVIFFIEYVHRELIYRTSGQKDAVAFGMAKLADGGEYRDVRILFSRVHETATLRGLELEGPVKVGRIDPSHPLWLKFRDLA